MRRISVIVALVAALVFGSAAATPPAEFGTTWDNPRTAGPPVARPPTRSCTEQIVDHGFADYSTFVSAYAPPAGCPGPWAKVVLRLDGAVKGRQFDRLGWLTVGGVMVFKTSTPEPSPDGIAWSVEKDVSGYAALLRTPQAVNMFLGNTVNETYTGILFIKVSLTFYATDRAHPAPPAASDVLPLAGATTSGADLTGTVTVPRNSERLLAEVYATGSGGGCEEFWYLTAPASSGYGCPADPGPYREVQVLLDGQVAGIAEPFPHVYTGGWGDPFLWYVLPAPRAFDVHPITYDLTPYLPLLTDGAAHQVAVHVVGVPAGQPGWDTPISFLAWRDPGSAQVTGRLLARQVGSLTNQSTVQVSGTDTTVTTRARHELTAAGLLRTSHGLVTTLVHQRLGNDNVHRWGDGANANPESIAATWTDQATSLVAGISRFAGLTDVAQRYAMDATAFLDATGRYGVTMTFTDAATTATPHGVTRLDDTYTGEASYVLNAPRTERHATGTSAEHYRTTGYDRTIRTRNGFVIDD